MVNVGKYTSPLDPMGIRLTNQSTILNHSQSTSPTNPAQNWNHPNPILNPNLSETQKMLHVFFDGDLFLDAVDGRWIWNIQISNLFLNSEAYANIVAKSLGNDCDESVTVLWRMRCVSLFGSAGKKQLGSVGYKL